MKSFFSSLAIFALMLGMIVCNYLYIEETCATLNEKAVCLPTCEHAELAVKDLVSYWESESKNIRVSTSQYVVNKMNDYLSDLCYAVANNDAQFFECARYRAISIIKEIKNAESLRLENWV
jgi:hypothetical protein